MGTLYQAVAALWRGHVTLPVRGAGRSPADVFLQRVRLQGYQGPFKPSVMFGPAMVCFRTQGTRTVIVSDFWVAPEARGLGIGATVIARLTELADLEGVTLRLRPSAFDRQGRGPTTDDLWAWYERHGFVRDRTWATRNPFASAGKAAA
jgi:GNAT superfamily N-acetyltransferase